MGSKEVFNPGVQERGKITLETVTHNLYENNILDWETAFSVSDQDYKTFKQGFGIVRIGIIRGFQAELNIHKGKYAKAEEHVVTESFGKFGEPRNMIIDGMEIPFISSEAEFTIREMLDVLPVRKDWYLAEMERRTIAVPEEILKRNINFLNKYFHLGLTLREEKIDGVDIYYFLKIPETTKVKFGEESTKQ